MKEKQSGKTKEKEFDSLSDCQYIFPDLLQDDVDGFVVNAEVLWNELNKPQGRYSKWYNRKIKDFYIEGVDFTKYFKKIATMKNGNGKIVERHWLSIHCAKGIITELLYSKENKNGEKLLSFLNSFDKEKVVIVKPKRKEIKFLEKLEQSLKPFNLTFKRQYSLFSGKYRIDAYIEKLNIAIEYDEEMHKTYSYDEEEGRQKEIEKELGCKFIRVSENNSDEYNIGYVFKELYPHLYVEKQIN